MIKYRLYTYHDLQKLEADTPLVKSKIKNGKFVFDNSTIDLEFVYLGNSEDLEEALQVPLKEIVFDTPQNKLRYLDASKCNIEQIVIKNCPNLQTLYLNNNQLKSIRFEGRFRQLELINLDRNQLTELDFRISDFPELKFLYLHENKLQDLSNLAPFFINDDFDFNIQKNEGLHTPPRDTVDKGKAAIRKFFLDLYEGEAPVKDIRLILMGNTTAGKTSLAKFFLDKFNPKEEDGSTHGIKQYEWHPFEEDKEKTVHIWDFGGQEFYHATHRYFLTGEVVYVILWEKLTNDSIEIDQNIHFPYSYWIQNILYFTKESKTPPILLIQNKIDMPGNEISNPPDFSEVEKPYHFISIWKAHAEKEKIKNGIKLERSEIFLKKTDSLQDDLLAIIEDNLKGYVPVYWNDVKNEIVNSTDSKWTYSHYQDICTGFGKRKIDIKGCTDYLRNRGFLLYFPDIPSLRDTVFIKPTDVTDKIFIILGKKVLKNGGKFTKEDARMTFRKKVHKKNGEFSLEDKALDDECDAYIDLMKAPNFELIFEYPHIIAEQLSPLYTAGQYIPQNKAEYIAPQYLPKEEPESWEKDACKMDAIAFAIQFPDYLPRNVMVRLISRLGKHLAKPVFYKYGIIVTYEMENKEKDDVMVQCFSEERKIVVRSKAKFIHENCIKDIFTQLQEINDNNDEILLSFDDKNYATIGRWKENAETFERTENIMFTHNGQKCNINDYIELTTKKNKVETTTHIKYIEQLIEDDKIGEAISQLLTGADKSGQVDLRNDMILLSARFKANEGDKHKNTIDQVNYKMEKAKVAETVLENLKGYRPIGNYDIFGQSDATKDELVKVVSTFDEIPEYFIPELKKQIEDEYRKILDFNEILSDMTTDSLKTKYSDKIKQCKSNIERTKAMGLENISQATPLIPQHTIESFIDKFGNDIFERLDDLKNMVGNLENMLSEVSISIHEQEIDQNPADKQQADELIQAIRALYDKIDKADFPKKRELGEGLNGEMSTGNKLKLIIPLIPGILQYEKDITFTAKEPVKSWKDLWHVFVKRKKE